MNFLNTNLFFRNIQVEGYENIIDMMVKKAEELNLCRPEFHKEVLERERLSSTTFDSMVAIPHSLYCNCEQSFMGVVVNDEPIYWDDRKVHIVLLIGVKAKDEHFFQTIIDNIIPFFSDNANILRCLSVNTYDEFVETLSNLIF